MFNRHVLSRAALGVTLCGVIGFLAAGLPPLFSSPLAMQSPSKPDIADKRLEELRLIRVPLARQATDYTCGAAAMQSVLAYYGDEFAESYLAKELRTNSNEGTDYKKMVEFARGKGYTAELKQGMQLPELKAKVDAGIAVICLIQAWTDKKVDLTTDWSDGHYVVAVGYDAQNVYFMDPWTLGNYTFIPAEEFVQRWHDREQNHKLMQLAMMISKPVPTYDPFMIKRLR